MARVIIPDDFGSQTTLLSNIIKQNNSLGAENPIAAFLAQRNISLTDDALAATNAQTHEAARSLFAKQSENYRQLRDNYFELPWKHLVGSAQFLKIFNKGNTKELGNWGITITDSGKIIYPAAFEDRVTVFGNFLEKHNSYAPGESPLQPYINEQQIDFTKDAGKVQQAVDNQANFKDAARQSENETELRNQLWQPVLEHITDIGNFLMKLYNNNPKALGNWGFTVHDSPRPPKKRTTKLKLGAKITNKSVVIGSTLTNIGEGDLHIYKGSGTTGTPVIVHKGEQFGIQKGWSTITVVNPSTLIEAKFTWMIKH